LQLSVLLPDTQVSATADFDRLLKRGATAIVRRLPCRQSGGREPSDDYIDLETDQLGGQFGKPVEVPLRRSKLKSNVLPLDITQIAQSLPELPPKLFRADIANSRQKRRNETYRKRRP
jgi:hypothetical protein